MLNSNFDNKVKILTAVHSWKWTRSAFAVQCSFGYNGAINRYPANPARQGRVSV